MIGTPSSYPSLSIFLSYGNVVSPKVARICFLCKRPFAESFDGQRRACADFCRRREVGNFKPRYSVLVGMHTQPKWNSAAADGRRPSLMQAHITLVLVLVRSAPLQPGRPCILHTPVCKRAVIAYRDARAWRRMTTRTALELCK